jgi:hypothetical protein
MQIKFDALLTTMCINQRMLKSSQQRIASCRPNQFSAMCHPWCVFLGTPFFQPRFCRACKISRPDGSEDPSIPWFTTLREVQISGFLQHNTRGFGETLGRWTWKNACSRLIKSDRLVDKHADNKFKFQQPRVLDLEGSLRQNPPCIFWCLKLGP